MPNTTESLKLNGASRAKLFSDLGSRGLLLHPGSRLVALKTTAIGETLQKILLPYSNDDVPRVLL